MRRRNVIDLHVCEQMFSFFAPGMHRQSNPALDFVHVGVEGEN